MITQTNITFIGGPETNAVLLAWDAKQGVDGFVIQKSDDGVVWDQYITMPDGDLTNWTEYGDRALVDRGCYF